MNRYEITGTATITGKHGKQTIKLDKVVAPGKDETTAIRAALLQSLDNGRVSATDLDNIIWFRPAVARLLPSDQPALPIAPAANGFTKLDPAAIRADGGTQARAGLDEATVDEYAAAMSDGATFPPIVVFYDGTEYWLGDGFHRIAAHKRARSLPGMPGRFDPIEAEVKAGTRRDAVLYAAGANASHGLRRTNADKQRAVTVLLEDDEWGKWSDREIARRCAVDHKSVGKIRASLGKFPSDNGDGSPVERTYTTKHGTLASMNTAAINKDRLPRIMAVEAEAPAAPVVTEKPPDFDKGLRDALHSFQGAEARWAEHQRQGLSDAELRNIIGKEFGADGASSGPGRTPVAYRGGRDPEFYYNAITRHGRTPDLRGAALVQAVRELLHIPYPELELTGEADPDPETGYASIRELEQHVRQWLKSPQMAQMGHSDPHHHLIDIKEKRHGHGVAWNNLKWGLDNDQVAYLVADLRQACNNVLDQLRQRSTPPTPRAVTLPDSAYKAVHASLHVHPKAGAELERVFFHAFRPFVAVAMTSRGDTDTFHAYELIEAGLYDGPTGPLYQGLPVTYATHDYRLGNPHDFSLLAPAELDPLDVLAEKLAAVPWPLRHRLAEWLNTAIDPQGGPDSEFLTALVDLLLATETDEEE